MAFGPEDKPRLLEQKQWKSLPRDPVELLLLAHIDGRNTVRDLAIFCAKPPEEVSRILDRLAQAQIVASSVVVVPEDARGPSSPSGSPSPEEFLVDPRFLKKLNEIDSGVLAESVDLEPRRKEEILLLYHSLAELTPFQLFGIGAGASDKDVKRAYQRLSMRFHPDRYYGKNLGSFKPMMERIFRVISETFALLSSAEGRARLAAIYPDAAAMPAAAPPPPENPPVPPSSAQPPAKPQPAVSASPPKPAAAASPPPVAAPVPPASSEGRPTRHRVGLRNQIASILARTESKSMVSGDTSSGESEPESIILPPPGGYKTPPVRNTLLHKAAAEKLQRIQTHLKEGKNALATKNYGTAASHFKLVLSLDPQHEEAARLYKDAEAKNREFLGNSYAARAHMESDMGDHEKAAELWELAVENLPTLENVMAAAAAFLLIKNHVKARQYAQQAVQIAERPDTLLLLARVYIDAGMCARAQATLKTILDKMPRHPEALRLMREAEKCGKSG